jgi:hypothetical protein
VKARVSAVASRDASLAILVNIIAENGGPIKYEYFCFTFAIGSVALNPEVRAGLGFEERRGSLKR